eukprot:CAMPEP_0196571694 /NCGR_PEP_ID=MMETSP1081-20130531/1832_1 /TAXON_ID=36882 /ORGANISM="Pyramimonas amylifera, Strain CCMP720" /LENGTH=196 /DNA_ID=CAMNT_0041888729 /DNA_START=240 /DNA_END=830 /DNA_ORIENTATION=+
MAEVICWSADIGTLFISVYDEKGVFQSFLNPLSDRVNDILSSSAGRKHNTKYRVQFSSGLAGKAPAQEETGATDGDLVKVEVLSRKDVEDEVFRNMFTSKDISGTSAASAHADVSTNPSSASNLSQRPVYQALSEACEANSLEAAVVFGQAINLSGYPPWRTYLCQIIHMGELRYATLASLCEHIQRHRVTQRYGR